MWVWRMTLVMMKLTVTMMMMIQGVFSLPAIRSSTYNDRPIIGILAQEIHGSLADSLTEILNLEHNTEFLNVNRERTVAMERFEYSRQTLRVQNSSSELQLRTNTQGTTKGHSSHVRSMPESFEEEMPKTSPSSTLGFSFPKNASYIGASYVKFVEAAGARVVPIFINKDREYYEHILESINGVLFPGGAVPIDESSAFGRAGKIMYEIANEMNDRGDVFPLWGTCLGFELMMGLAANGREIRARCDALNKTDYLKLDAHYADGYLLRHLPKRLLRAVTTEPITSNFHRYCVTPKNFTLFGVDKVYRALAYSADRRGVEYVAVAEAWDYPFFAVQFHPEKSPYEWTTEPGHNNISHASAAVDTANYLAHIFVNYARRNNHQFANASEEASSLIYNFSPIYTGQYLPMEQTYIF